MNTWQGFVEGNRLLQKGTQFLVITNSSDHSKVHDPFRVDLPRLDMIFDIAFFELL